MRSERIRYLLFLFLSLSAFFSFASECRIISINISGNKVTKSFVVLRELPFSIGDQINTDSLTDLLAKARGQLINLNLFNQVKINSQIFDSIGILWIQVNIELVEKWYLWPIPFVSNADRNLTEWKENGYDLSRLNVGLYLFKYNTAGINHTIKAALVTGYTKLLSIEYRVPYWDKKKHFGSLISVSHYQNHEMAFNTIENKLKFYKNETKNVLKGWNGRTGLFFRPGYFTSHLLLLECENVVVSDSLLTTERNPNYLGKGNSVSAFFLSYERLNRVVNNKNYPTKGHQAFVSFQIGKMKSLLSETLLEVFAEYSKYLQLQKKIYLAVSFSGLHRITHDNSFRYNPAMGYGYFVRGYEPYVINGNSFLLAKSSLRWAVLDEKQFLVNPIPLKNYRKMPVSSFVNLNFDAGFVNSNTSNTANDLGNTLLLGGGIGWDWVFYYDKVLRFEYSINGLGQHGLYIQFTKPF